MSCGVLALDDLAGYTGDGTKTGCWELNCQGELCFPGVPCVGVEGITCGPCPEGYQGKTLSPLTTAAPYVGD